MNPFPEAFDHPEVSTFHGIGKGQGWTLEDHDPARVRFLIETCATDEVELEMQFDLDHLWLHLTMFPEAAMAGLTGPQMAAVIAKWLRDTAAKMDEAAAGVPIPASFFAHCEEAEARRLASLAEAA